MRLYLDTNMLLALIGKGDCQLCRDVSAAFADYSNLLYASTVCIHEAVHLAQIGKVDLDLRRTDIATLLADVGVEPVTVDLRHLQTLAALPLYPDHRDPNDRLIVAQAIADRAMLVSSDRKLSLYRRDGLDLLFNER